MTSTTRERPESTLVRRDCGETVGRVEAFLRAHIDSPLRVSTLSRVAGLSERGLRDAFYRIHGMSPKRWMLAERLKQVHSVLSDGESAPISVTGAATRCGFYELGRFAGTYKDVFGEAPSETLRSATRRSAENSTHRKGQANVCTR